MSVADNNKSRCLRKFNLKHYWVCMFIGLDWIYISNGGNHCDESQSVRYGLPSFHLPDPKSPLRPLFWSLIIVGKNNAASQRFTRLPDSESEKTTNNRGMSSLVMNNEENHQRQVLPIDKGRGHFTREAPTSVRLTPPSNTKPQRSRFERCKS